MIKVLITGNSGYIGSHLTQILQKNKEIEIHGLDKSLPKIPVDQFYQLDINTTTSWNCKCEYDCVIHLAAEVSVGKSVNTPALYYQTNTIGTLNVLKNIRAKRVVVASTGAAEGLGSPYGISKRAMEDIVFEYCNNTGIPFTIFRFYNVIGSDGILPTNPDGLFSALLAATQTGQFTIHGNDYNTADGTCVRDYTHVNEICHAVISGIYESTNTIEHLGHGTGTTVKEMVDLYKQVNGCDFQVTIGGRRDGDIESSVLDNPSKLMVKLYTLDELLTINRK